MESAKRDEETIVVMNVYSPCQLNKKFDMWNEIMHIKQITLCKLWCICSKKNRGEKKIKSRSSNTRQII